MAALVFSRACCCAVFVLSCGASYICGLPALPLALQCCDKAQGYVCVDWLTGKVDWRCMASRGLVGLRGYAQAVARRMLPSSVHRVNVISHRVKRCACSPGLLLLRCVDHSAWSQQQCSSGAGAIPQLPACLPTQAAARSSQQSSMCTLALLCWRVLCAVMSTVLYQYIHCRRQGREASSAGIAAHSTRPTPPLQVWPAAR